MIIVVLFYLHRTLLLRLRGLGAWNVVLIGFQLLLLFLAFLEASVWQVGIFFLLFIGIEWIRYRWGREVTKSIMLVSEYEEQFDQMNETFRVVRSERHEFLKHISAIHFMLEHDNPQGARAYLNQLVENYEETNLSIKGEKGVVAGVLHQAYRRAKKSGVEVIYDLDLPISTLPMSDYDLVSLMGNILSNSIDACEEWQLHKKQKATLSLQFYKRSGLYLLICKNDTLPIPTQVVDHLFDSYGHSTKGEAHHGLGTKVIKDIVEAHQGFLDFVYKEEQFELKIKIPAVK
ncbi:GHKL domain-containing protein [Radiobacillus deserti]|uniref:GHKL domain-containing protein n=2 Tax=Radiobacillus deserti TaxID=2594883 RepID=A0A516KL01_9BACI|nr:GHKL domain-containing protein [Radiobacillus deserti]